MPGRGTSEGRYLVEIDGVTAVRATEVSGLKLQHDAFELHEGNKPNPSVGRGNFKVPEITVKHAHALNETGTEVMQWLQDFIRGVDLTRRGMRMIVLDEDGISPVSTYELQDCVPCDYTVETHSGGGNNPSFFSFMIRPEDMQML